MYRPRIALVISFFRNAMFYLTILFNYFIAVFYLVERILDNEKY